MYVTLVLVLYLIFAIGHWLWLSCIYSYLNISLFYLLNFHILLQIRVKHMITQGVVEQSPLASGQNRSNMASSGRILETNTENLLRMVLIKTSCLWVFTLLIQIECQLSYWVECFQVSYCENDVDCRRLLQLVHFGEKFDSAHCKKTCDNCLKIKSFVEKDVTEIAKQLVWKHPHFIAHIYILFFVTVVCP